MRKRFIRVGITLSILSVVFMFGNDASAVTMQTWKAGRILDDPIFTDKTSMSVSQIQDFLNSKVPTCDTNGQGSLEAPYWAPDYNNDGRTTHAEYAQYNSYGTNFVFTCLKDYYEVPKTTPSLDVPASNYGGKPIPAGAKSAAQLIWDSAQRYSISPKVLLVKIATESAGPLTTDNWPFPKQYLYAMGAHCPDTAEGHKCDPNYGGFSIQMDEAAALMRWYLDSMTQPWWAYKRPYTNNNILWQDVHVRDCGSGNVYIETMATAALYTYTPYQPNRPALENMYGTGDSCSTYGNRNFWRVYNDWFGSPVSGSVASPLFKSTSSNEIYAVINNKKYLIPSFDIMTSYGLINYSAANVSQEFLDGFSNGTALTSSIAKKQFDPTGTLYMFDGGKRYPIGIESCKQLPSGNPVNNSTWGLDCFNTATTLSLPNELVDNFSAQDITLSPIAINKNSVWLMQAGERRLIKSPVTINALGGWDRARWMQDYHINQPLGQIIIPDGSVVKFDNNDSIFLAQSDTLNPLVSMDQYYAWNLSKQPYFFVPASENTAKPLTISTPLAYCATSDSTSYYLLAQDTKKVTLGADKNYWPLTVDSCKKTSQDLLSSIPSTVASTTYRSTSGAIFTTGYGVKYLFPTIDDFKQLGNSTYHLTNISSDVEKQLTYGGLNLAENRLFKVTGNDTIRMVRTGKSLAVYSTSYPGLAYDKIITVDETTGNRYPLSGVYTP